MNCGRAWRLSPVLALFALSCSSASGPPSSGTFTPIMGASFNNFCSWQAAEATTADDAGDGLHGTLGPLRVYWNQAPTHGATAFPPGMLIVKESEDANPADRTIFAMAKVGGGYNSGGAVNWEWFSLKQDANCNVTVLWSGPAAPATETYAMTSGGQCNGCHVQMGANDYVWDSALQLSNF
jgi:hypothetical protein